MWKEGLKYPDSRLFPLSLATHPETVSDYLQAEATAANYAFVNRLLLAELLRLRLRQVYGEVRPPWYMAYPTQHHLTGRTRLGQPVIIPGSMGAPSYLLVGLGNSHWCCSESHGAGRSRSRFDLSRKGNQESEADLGLTGVDCITLRAERRIEEAPAAYKPITAVIDTQARAGLVQVVARYAAYFDVQSLSRTSNKSSSRFAMQGALDRDGQILIIRASNLLTFCKVWRDRP